MVKSAVLGFPRMGANRELKKATEAYWSGKSDVQTLLNTGKELRAKHWKIQKDAGVDIIPSNDFSYYDQVLDHSLMFDVVPDRYTQYNLPPIDVLFAMGRGLQKKASGDKQAIDVPASEMVKWFDSNYHYVRPTFKAGQKFKLATTKPIDEYKEALELGIETRPVILGPVSFLYLGKADRDENVEPIDLLDDLLPVYEELFKKLYEAGVKQIQVDEPIIVLDLPEKVKKAFQPAYLKLAQLDNIPSINSASYFGDVLHNFEYVKFDFEKHPNLKLNSFHIDLVRAPEQLDEFLKNTEGLGPKGILSVGVVDGRNIWKTDFKKAIDTVQKAVDKLGSERVYVSTSSSLLHTPHTLASEKKLDPEVADWFSFATEKCSEVAIIAKAINQGVESVKAELEANAKSMESRRSSKRTNNADVKKRQQEVTEAMHKRQSEFPTRLAAQKEHLKLPIFPTTTIGSFPQTPEIRVQRNKFTKGEITTEQYEDFIKKEIDDVVKRQEAIGLDVLVHGEPERNDMVQYFGEQLDGYVFTTNGWVQSYGSRCVRPPIVVGDISRPAAMTVKESKYAQSITKKPMKGMLTGPITCLRWSFPRDDVHQSVQAQQLALALRDEVCDLEAAGIFVIQVDEPALREGLPLRSGKERDAYLKWAVDSFRLSTSGVKDSTQIHSHFCYSEFQDFFHAIAALDADVLSIENSKSDAKLLKVFVNESYPRHIGPGVYDIHSPRIPPYEEIKNRISEMLQYLKPDQLWIDPDCGLKTRKWEETTESLENMVKAAKFYREQHASA